MSLQFGVRAVLVPYGGSAKRVLPWLLLGAGFLLCVWGFVANALWRIVPMHPEELLARLAVGSMVAAWVLGRLLQCRLATAMLIVWLVALVCLAGFAACVAAAFVLLAALSIGAGLVPHDSAARPVLAALAGIALMTGVVGWTLPFHIGHIRAVYIAALLLILAWRWRALMHLLRPIPAAWSRSVARAPASATFAVMVLGLASTGAWLPTILYDDLSYHLALPAQLAQYGYYLMNAGTNVWALNAWSGDVLHAIAHVLAETEARGAVDVLWFVTSAVLMWRLCEELELPPWLRWLALALFAAMPELMFSLTGMQTEGPSMAVLLALALLIQRAGLLQSRDALLVALLFGLLLAIKVSNLWFALPLGVWLAWQWRAHFPWRVLPKAVLLVVVVAGSSYVYAYVLTGNPALPLFNGIFHSPFFPSRNFYDTRFHTGFRWGVVWNLVFHSAIYRDTGPCPAPFFLVVLAGSSLVALARPRSRALTLVAAACFLLPLSIIQYLRYATPGIALLLPALLCGVPVLSDAGRGKLATALLLWALVFAGMLFASSGSWQLKSGVLKTRLAEGKTGAIEKFAPTRRVAEVIRNRYGETARTLFVGAPYAAELAGRAFVTNWYDPALQRLALQREAKVSSVPWENIFTESGVNLVVAPATGIPAGLADAMRDERGVRVFNTGDVALWELHPGKAGVENHDVRDGVAVTFNNDEVPLRGTLVHGQIEVTCNPKGGGRGHIVAGWRVTDVTGRVYQRFSWVLCGPDGVADSTIDFTARKPVKALHVLVQPDPLADMGLRLIASRASFRIDRTAQADLAKHLRHELAFWKKPKHLAAAVSP